MRSAWQPRRSCGRRSRCCDDLARLDALAPPGAWVSTADGLVAHDAPDLTVPLLGGPDGKLAAAGPSLWAWDPRVGALIRIEPTT